MWLVIIFAENLNVSFTYLQQQDQTELIKKFFITFSLSAELLEDKQWVKLAQSSIVSMFPNSFALVLDSNFQDLSGTNTD